MEQHQIDFNALLDALLPFAEQMLWQHGAFHPFGATVKPSDEVELAAAYDGADTQTIDLIEMMKSGFAMEARAGTVRATALAYDSRITLPEGPSDAIAIALDHANGSSLVAYVPYALRDNTPSFGEMIFDAGEGRIFAN